MLGERNAIRFSCSYQSFIISKGQTALPLNNDIKLGHTSSNLWGRSLEKGGGATQKNITFLTGDLKYPAAKIKIAVSPTLNQRKPFHHFRQIHLVHFLFHNLNNLYILCTDHVWNYYNNVFYVLNEIAMCFI